MSEYVRTQFWMVWRENGSAPTCRHFTKQIALAEAERLAALNPGEVFFVLKATAGVVSQSPKVERVKLERLESDDDIPF